TPDTTEITRHSPNHSELDWSAWDASSEVMAKIMRHSLNQSEPDQRCLSQATHHVEKLHLTHHHTHHLTHHLTHHHTHHLTHHLTTTSHTTSHTKQIWVCKNAWMGAT